MIAEDVINSFELDDITKSHAHIIARNAEMMFLDVYEKFNQKFGLEKAVISVRPKQMGKLVEILQAEIEIRREICKSQNVLRISDLDLSKLNEHQKDDVKEVYVHVLLPRYISNVNSSILTKLMSICVPLSIHLVMYHSEDSREDNIEQINSVCYWTLLPEIDVVRCKLDTD